MSFESALQEFVDFVALWAPAYVLVLARVAAIFIMSPMLGSSRVPRRVRALMVMLLALGVAGAVRPPLNMPGDFASFTLALGGEIVFGIAMGMMVSFVFVAAQWAGEIMGQQMGLSIAQAFDPQFGQSSSLVGDLQYMLTLVIFLSPLVNGPAALIKGVHASFSALPLLTVGMTQPLFDTLVGLFAGSAMLALQLAAPMLVTILIVDVALGCVGKTMPQMNIMTTGLSMRAIVGMIVLYLGIARFGEVMTEAINDYVSAAQSAYAVPAGGGVMR